jgi:hypothetical protein
MSQLHTCSYHCHIPECIKAQRDELRDKVEALRKDAERYRWIREPIAGREFFVSNLILANADDYLDAAIDAAMKDAP